MSAIYESVSSEQEIVDTVYAQNGPCCAGCDFWVSGGSSRIGECRRSAPVSASERIAMIGMDRISIDIGAGHPFTVALHHCGDFRDGFDWSKLSPWYLRKIGMSNSTPTTNNNLKQG